MKYLRLTKESYSFTPVRDIIDKKEKTADNKHQSVCPVISPLGDIV